MKVLVKVNGWLGDNIVAQPIAELVRKEKGATTVDWFTGFDQVTELLMNNPNIDTVITPGIPGPNPTRENYDDYDEVLEVGAYTGTYPLPIEHQISAGIKNPTSEYKVYNSRERLENIVNYFHQVAARKPLVGICLTWKNSYKQAINTAPIVNLLKQYYTCIPLGLDPRISQAEGASDRLKGVYANTAAAMQLCDVVIGSEGGLTNLAAGTGTRCIYTTDFTYALAGPAGSHYKSNNPLELLGPAAYFKDAGHIPLDKDIHEKDYGGAILEELNRIYR